MGEVEVIRGGGMGGNGRRGQGVAVKGGGKGWARAWLEASIRLGQRRHLSGVDEWRWQERKWQ